MRTITLRTIALLLFLAGCWVVMSGFFKPFFLISGFLSCLITVWIAARMNVVDAEGQPLHLTLRTPLYWLWLLKEMLISSVRVAHISLAQRPAINPTFGWVPSHQPDFDAHVIYANSITLTPGTIAVDLCPSSNTEARIYVHALEAESLEALHEGTMSQLVSRLCTNSIGAHITPSPAKESS